VGFQVHAWLIYFMDCIEGNVKPRAKFWSAIDATYNNTTEPHRQQTLKNLKDHWSTYNKQVSLFNQIYNQEAFYNQSGADDAMVLKFTKSGGFEFKCLHWWEAVRHQPKWRARSTGSSTIDPFLSTSDPATEEEVTHPIGQDRAKAATQKGKVKEGLNSQSESSSAVGGIMSTLKKLNTSFAKAQLWK
jgi:hypothetical protein